MTKNKNDNRRARAFNITINKGATCFDNIQKIIGKELSSADIYALILHDKDIIEETGELKKPHYHLVIEYKNAHYFTAITKIFEGAHIEPCNNKVASYQYLIHQNNKEKYQYSQTDIQSNHIVKIKEFLNLDQFEDFNPNRIIYYFRQGTISNIQYYMRFGQQVKNYIKFIDDLRKEYLSLTKEQQQALPIPIDELPF